VTLGTLASGCGRTTANWVGATPGGSAGGRPAAPSPSAGALAAGSSKPRYLPGKVMLGAYLDLKGMTEDKALELRREQLGRDPAILHLYYDWDSPMPNGSPAPAGTDLMISWAGTYYAPILDGSQDALIAQAADTLAALKQPVFLRWAWEMNGNWFRWDGPHNGNNPAGFVKAWRHLHDIFVARKALNVAWVWGPNAESAPGEPWNDMSKYYPGDDYVDWVAVSGYSSGRGGPETLFQNIVDRYGARKPIMIGETGIQEKGGTVKADWIQLLHRYLLSRPEIGALVWFDTDNDKGTNMNWRIDSTPSALAAYKAMANDPRFITG
jgi:hypothetical protein